MSSNFPHSGFSRFQGGVPVTTSSLQSGTLQANFSSLKVQNVDAVTTNTINNKISEWELHCIESKRYTSLDIRTTRVHH
jgi:hypothetical protein